MTVRKSLICVFIFDCSPRLHHQGLVGACILFMLMDFGCRVSLFFFDYRSLLLRVYLTPKTLTTAPNMLTRTATIAIVSLVEGSFFELLILSFVVAVLELVGTKFYNYARILYLRRLKAPSLHGQCHYACCYDRCPMAEMPQMPQFFPARSLKRWTSALSYPLLTHERYLSLPGA